MIDELQQKLLTTQQVSEQKQGEMKSAYEQKQHELMLKITTLQQYADKYANIDEKILAYEKKIVELNAQIDAT